MVRRLTLGGDGVSVVVGRAGTGKTMRWLRLGRRGSGVAIAWPVLR